MVEELKTIEVGFTDYIAPHQKEFDWLRQGKEQGFEAGLQQGLEQGIEQGIERGTYQTKLETERNLLAMGLSPEQISQATKLPPETISHLSAQET